MSNFTWIPFFRELFKTICEKHDKTSLCKIAHELIPAKFNDRFSNGTEKILEEIDPLTFISIFNRQISVENRIELCKQAKQIFSLNADAPQDFDDIPRQNNQNFWFFQFAKDRENDVIDNLWGIAKKFSTELVIEENDFDYIVGLRGNGIAKLTSTLFVLNPEKYYPTDSKSEQFVYDKSSNKFSSINEASFKGYEAFLNDAKIKFPNEFSYEADERLKAENKNEVVPENEENPTEETNYWLISPGQNRRLWTIFIENKICAIGWDYLGDLKQYKSKNDIKKAIQNFENTVSDRPHASLACWQFANKMQEGDIVIAKQGKKKLLGYGVIKSDYYYDETQEEYKSVRRVDWKITSQRDDLDFNLNIIKTLTNIDPNDAEKLISIMDGQSSPKANVIGLREKLISKSGLDEETFDEYTSCLARKKQIILQGSPGTGKSYLAKILAEYLMNDNFHAFEKVQFHPSYSYEDFIEGIRPSENGHFKRHEGIFKRLCQRASNEPEKKFVLMIDEINRGNLSKIFGELLYLLEYREEKIKLTYSPEETFKIPDNLFLIGTMNMADRSLAMIDYALRRRFYFISIETNYELIDAYLSDNEPIFDIEKLINNFKEVNKEISKKLGSDFQIGHSYFISEQMRITKVKDLETIWNFEFKPLLNEYFFDSKDIVTNLEDKFFDGLD
jgi:5-methylcytosine-specific restriction protein B